MPRPRFSEDEPGRAWDKCVTDAVLKSGGGLALGAVTSILFFSRKGWPVLFGGGFGFGMAVANCERALNNSVCGGNKVSVIASEKIPFRKTSHVTVLVLQEDVKKEKKFCYGIVSSLEGAFADVCVSIDVYGIKSFRFSDISCQPAIYHYPVHFLNLRRVENWLF